MINKYKFLLSGSNENQTTITSIFVSGDFLLPFSASTDNGVVDFYMSWANYDSSNGKITSFYPYNGSGYYSRRFPDNNYGFVYGGAPIVTGYTIVQNLFNLYSTNQKLNFANETTNYVHSASGSSIKVGVEFEDVFEGDTFVNVNLKRSFGSLETLTIKNNALGSWKTLNSPTGIVFGTLTARQNINDINGNPLEIPLRNVPIMIFNKTSTNVTTTNPAQGGRTPVNMIQNSERNYYTNDFAYNFDQQILPDVTTKNVTDTYQYSTITNENGEYILRDVPTGVQTLIFEIDLLKQGLTQEEVELNVSPYPKTNNLTPEQVPHLIYREIPINVLSSWGYQNTGYTNCDINVTVDLRKWATFFVPPITAYGKTYDEILQAGFQPNMCVRVRDMAQRGTNGELFPTTSIECVDIPDITKRDTTRLLGWTNETRQLRDLIVFNQLQYSAFKVPANIYDPNAYKTDGSGNTISDKGVWLASYEFKMFFTKENSFFRATGFNLGTFTNNTLTENFQNNFDLTNNNSTSTGITIGVFPYEKPWTATYPAPYSIPKIPNKLNTNILYNSDGAPVNMVIPKYFDGDRVGAKTILNGINFGGWGAQINYGNEVYPNYFAQQVTTSDLYKYEAAISQLDEFSNGYTPNYSYGNVPTNQSSSVLNGELYQRVECGHGYFMWAQGFPRVINLSGYDELYSVDYLSGGTDVPNFTGESGVLYYSSYLNNNFLFNNDTLLATDFIQLQQYQKGYVYLYKITDPDPKLLAPPTPPLQKRSVNLNFQNIYIQRGGTSEDARAVLGTTDKNHRYKFYNYIEEFQKSDPGAVLTITNNGIVSVDISVGMTTQRITPGQSFGFPMIDVANQKIINLPTNDTFDFGLNTYYNTNYTMTIDNLQFYFPNGNKSIFVPHINQPITGINLTGETSLTGVKTYYLISNALAIRVRGTIGKPKPNGLIIDCQCQADVQGMLLVSSFNTFVDSYEFRETNTTPDGGNGENLPYTYLNSD